MFKIALVVALALGMACGNTFETHACHRDCSNRYNSCLTTMVLLNVPTNQSPVFNAAGVLSCNTDHDNCNATCSQLGD